MSHRHRSPGAAFGAALSAAGFSAAGSVLAAAIAGVLLVRRPRPIHSAGAVLTGRVEWLRRSDAVPAGIRWIDEPPAAGSQPVTARISRALGLPPPLPDVLGLAFKVDTPDGVADIALSSTGLRFPGRFGLTLHRSPSRAWYGSLMPYRGTRGPVLLAARPRAAGADGGGEWLVDLFHAGPRGRWRRFAVLRLRGGAGDRDDLRFDPAGHPPPGAHSYEWSRRLRSPAYRLAQQGELRRP